MGLFSNCEAGRTLCKPVMRIEDFDVQRYALVIGPGSHPNSLAGAEVARPTNDAVARHAGIGGHDVRMLLPRTAHSHQSVAAKAKEVAVVSRGERVIHGSV